MTTIITDVPDRNDPATFPDKGDAFCAQLAALSVDFNNGMATVADSVAAVSAGLGAALWNSSTSYTQNVSRAYSTVDGRMYRFIGASGTTSIDPASDSTKWRLEALPSLPMVTVATSTGNAYEGGFFNCTYAAGAQGLYLPTTGLQGMAAIEVFFTNGRSDNVIYTGSKKVNGVAGDLTVRTPYRLIRLRWVGGSTDWGFFAK